MSVWVKRKCAAHTHMPARFREQVTWFSRGANIGNGPDPPFSHIADLIARHRRKIVTKKQLPYDGRRTGFGHLCGHFFEKTLALVSRIVSFQQPESRTGQKGFHLVGRRDMAD